MATTTLMSFAEFERLDFGVGQLELLKGELIRLPPPYARHMEIVERLYRLVFEAVEKLRSSIVAAPGRKYRSSAAVSGELLPWRAIDRLRSRVRVR